MLRGPLVTTTTPQPAVRAIARAGTILTRAWRRLPSREGWLAATPCKFIASCTEGPFSRLHHMHGAESTSVSKCVFACTHLTLGMCMCVGFIALSSSQRQHQPSRACLRGCMSGQSASLAHATKQRARAKPQAWRLPVCMHATGVNVLTTIHTKACVVSTH